MKFFRYDENDGTIVLPNFVFWSCDVIAIAAMILPFFGIYNLVFVFFISFFWSRFFFSLWARVNKGGLVNFILSRINN